MKLKNNLTTIHNSQMSTKQIFVKVEFNTYINLIQLNS